MADTPCPKGTLGGLGRCKAYCRVRGLYAVLKKFTWGGAPATVAETGGFHYVWRGQAPVCVMMKFVMDGRQCPWKIGMNLLG